MEPEAVSTIGMGATVAVLFAALVVKFNFLGRRSDQVKAARQWVDGCQTMIAKGVPSPLEQAQAQLDRGLQDRDVAIEQLHQLGYRARFGAH